MAQRTTDDLQMELMTRADLRGFLQDNQAELIEPNMAQALQALFATRQMTKAALARQAGMSEVYLHQVFSGRRNPSRDRLLCLCVCLELSLEEVQQLLKEACYAPLYPRNRRDSIITYGILHRLELPQINETLFAQNEKALF